MQFKKKKDFIYHGRKVTQTYLTLCERVWFKVTIKYLDQFSLKNFFFGWVGGGVVF